jgi:hypothetical protein
MKKIIFLLLFPLWGLGGLFAQATVTPISVDYDRHEVTFRVAWNPATALNNRVWVWVDLCPVTGSTASTFQQAVISAASAITGSIATVSGNQRGFYVTTNPSTVTATLSNASGKFNWCAYGSDYPPNATSYNAGTYTLKGTPPFVITGNGTIQNVNKYVGTVINSLTDATGYPGGVGRDQPHNGGTCAPGLTAIGNYCRDLAADAATYTTCSGTRIEIKKKTAGKSIWNPSALCPSGWRWPTYNELKCAWTSGLVPAQRWFWALNNTNSDCTCTTACSSVSCAAALITETITAYGQNCDNCQAFTAGRVYLIGASNTVVDVLCVRN